MRPTPLRLILPAITLLALAGCSTTSTCTSDVEYLKAKERPPLDLPANVGSSELIKPVVIPPAAADPQKLDPQPRCLDYPPQYYQRKLAAGATPDAAVQDWAAAWAERKPDAVMQAYSRSFQSTAAGGSTAFLAEREEQVATGSAPSAMLEDVTVVNTSPDRSVVTFTQVFGKERVRRELTLAREGQVWRIVAERTL